MRSRKRYCQGRSGDWRQSAVLASSRTRAPTPALSSSIFAAQCSQEACSAASNLCSKALAVLALRAPRQSIKRVLDFGPLATQMSTHFLDQVERRGTFFNDAVIKLCHDNHGKFPSQGLVSIR
mmetsp:Transcript_31375/g.57601  ORF Transcript_31375/g.57601 Transcript_31375/m.57601 type:complete len:123 (-) Transcript_31375:633-1001(-)